MLRDDEVERILVVTAHPDDVDFGAAGSIARWTDAGAHVAYCIVTSGDAGGFDPDVPRSAIAGIRQEEQTKAAREIGVDELHWLGYPDGCVEVSMDLRRDISRVIRQVRPRRVVTQSPLRTLDSMYRNHPDHIATGEAVCCAVYPDARNPFTFTTLMDEGHEPHSVEELFIMGSGPGEVFVDITETFDRKMAALRCHVSQMTDPDGMQERLAAWALSNGADGELGEGRMAERFVFMPTA